MDQPPEYAVPIRQVPLAILLKAKSNKSEKRADAGSPDWVRQAPE
jgi:hypothetical protein